MPKRMQSWYCSWCQEKPLRCSSCSPVEDIAVNRMRYIPMSSWMAKRPTLKGDIVWKMIAQDTKGVKPYILWTMTHSYVWLRATKLHKFRCEEVMVSFVQNCEILTTPSFSVISFSTGRPWQYYLQIETTDLLTCKHLCLLLDCKYYFAGFWPTYSTAVELPVVLQAFSWILLLGVQIRWSSHIRYIFFI